VEGGFIIETQVDYNGVLTVAPGTTTYWSYIEDLPGAAGDGVYYESLTNELGLDSYGEGRVPAAWGFYWDFTLDLEAAECDGLSGTADIAEAGAVVNLICTIGGGFEGIEDAPEFTFSPNPFNTEAPPSTVTITGSGFDPTYGMPIVQYFDMNGNLDAQQSATAVSSDGTTLTLSTPSFTELGDGTYAGVISNVASDGSYSYVGTTAVLVPAPFYLPTTYSDMATGDPNDYNPTINPGGPTTALFDDAIVISSDVYSYDQNGHFVDTPYEGQCTWSGFPSHVDANNLTLYIPYYTMGSFVGSSAAYYTVTRDRGLQRPALCGSERKRNPYSKHPGGDRSVDYPGDSERAAGKLAKWEPVHYNRLLLSEHLRAMMPE
jgi:hypothetical protein